MKTASAMPASTSSSDAARRGVSATAPLVNDARATASGALNKGYAAGQAGTVTKTVTLARYAAHTFFARPGTLVLCVGGVIVLTESPHSLGETLARTQVCLQDGEAHVIQTAGWTTLCPDAPEACVSISAVPGPMTRLLAWLRKHLA